MIISTLAINTYIGGFILPFARIGAMFMEMPVLGNQLIPKRIRLLLAVVVTVVMMPHIELLPVADFLSISAAILIIKQILIGLCMGFVLQLLVQMFIVGGQVIAMQSGLGFASMIDPANGASIPMVAQFYMLLVTLIYLSLNGHLIILEMLAQSFQTLPLSAELSSKLFWDISGLLSWVFQGAIYIALPIIISMLVINLSLGVLARSAPQLNIFAIGFPITLTLGLCLIYMDLNSINYHFHEELEHAISFIANIGGRNG